MNYQDQEPDNAGTGCLFLLLFLVLGSIGALIMLPSFMRTSSKAYQSEAKQYIGTMNRGQQAYFLENEKFANSINVLGIGIKNETENYLYQTVNQQERVINYAISKNDKLQSYVGGVFLVPDTTVTSNNQQKQVMTPVTIICQGKDLSIKKLNPPKLENNKPICAEGTMALY